MNRQRLPNRRASIAFDFTVGGLRYTATLSRCPDGRIGELFLTNHKSNSAADGAEWVGFPARSYQDKDGHTQWQALVEFAEGAKEARGQFRKQALAAIHAVAGEVA